MISHQTPLRLPLRYLPLVLLASLVVTGVNISPADGSVRGEFRVAVGPDSEQEWHANASGDVVFYSVYRQFRLLGTSEWRDPHIDQQYGRIQVRQDIGFTRNDGPWRTVYEKHWSSYLGSRCPYETDDSGHTYNCDLNEYRSTPTQGTHGLAGVWIRICKEIAGPDWCSRSQYVRNPYWRR